MKTTVDALTARQCGLPRSAELTRPALTAWQQKQLRTTLRHATASPFYREQMAGIAPESITLAGLHRLPFLTADMLRHEGLRLQCLSASEVARIVTLHTSGSTGAAKRLAFTAEELAATREFFHLGMENLLKPGESVLVLLPAETPGSVGDLLLRTLPAAGHPTSALWPPEPDAVREKIARSRPACVIGLPQHLLMMAENLPQNHSVRTVLLNSDYSPAALRRRIEAHGITTFLHYGATETGFGGGVECAAHHGCHLREAELLVEIIDPASGQPLPEGEPGEIVITTLLRRAMPLIRYRTGDMGSLLTAPCSCGGITARLLNPRRRQEVALENGTTLSGHQLDDLLFAVPGLLDYRATLHPDGLTVEYLAARDLPASLFPEAPAGLRWQKLNRTDHFSPVHTAKRQLHDVRNGEEERQQPPSPIYNECKFLYTATI